MWIGREWVELSLYRLGSALAVRLPLAWLQRGVACIATAVVAARERRVRWALTNVGIAYPDTTPRERRELVRASFVNIGWNVLDFMRMQSWDAQQVREHISLEGLEHLHAALEQGRGAILLVPHLGNFELGLQALAVAGIDCVVVERVLKNAKLHEHVRSVRARFGAQPVDRRGAARQMALALRKGRVLVLAIDQYSGRRGRVLVPFFGLRVPTSSAPAVLARRAKAPVLTCCVVRDQPDHHLGLIHPAPPVVRTGDRRADVQHATVLYYLSLEQLIRRFPTEWVWSYRRFRYSPDLDGDPYGRPVGRARASDGTLGETTPSPTECDSFDT